MKKPATIIPIAGGKGGVGKTFLAANLAVALADRGYVTLAVDLDLGGSNLHSFLGLSNRFPGIGDFLKARKAELEALVVSTAIPNLQFIPGDGRTPFMANIPYAQKIRLISRIRKLPADYILLDLGAGTSFNTLDFFRLSRYGFVITTPDYLAIMSMMAFLKHFILRVIERSFAQDPQIRKILSSFFKQPMTDQTTYLSLLKSEIASINPAAGEKVTKLCGQYRPRVIFNLGEHPDEIKIAGQIDKSLSSNLSLEVDYFGFVFKDPLVKESLNKRLPFLPNFSDSPAAESIRRIAERIVKYLDKPVSNSEKHLLKRMRKVYESR
ncbi:MAG: P-loop NTPase [Proteobacteria bacterium]|nr:P-loop NTPase [Pseudomonadota bacterium]